MLTSKKIENRQDVISRARFAPHGVFLCVLLTGLFAIPEIISAQPQKYSFQHLSVEHGLSHPRVECILQDSRGFLWVGTENGLNRYDGRTFNIYSHDPADSLSLSGMSVYSLYEDRSQTLWVGTNNGLNRYDRGTDSFTRFTPIPGDSTSLSGQKILSIFESARDTTGLWIATNGGVVSVGTCGLNRFDRQTEKFAHFQHDPNDPESLSDNWPLFILEDDAGFLWIGGSVLNRFDPKRRGKPVFKRYSHDPANSNSLSSDDLRAGVKDASGRLWFGTWGADALNRYDPRTGTFTPFRPPQSDPQNPYTGYVNHLTIDSDGMIWLCDAVLTRFNPQDESFLQIKFSPKQGNVPSSYRPMTAYEDHARNLWVGTRGSGLYKIDLKPQRFHYYQHEPENDNSLGGNDIQIIHEDRKGILWVAVHNGGIDRFDPQRETFAHFKHVPNDPGSLSANSISTIQDDSEGFIWAGTATGLNRIDPANHRITRFLAEPNAPLHLAADDITCSIFEDRSGKIWIGTFLGILYEYDRSTGTFKEFKIPRGLPDTPRNDVDGISEDQTGNLWLSAWEGCYLFNPRNRSADTIKGAFPGDEAKLGTKIYTDRNGNIWGLCRGLRTVDRKTQTLRLYRPFPNPANILGIDRLYNEPSGFYEDVNGMFWIGTRVGLHKFDPQQREFVAHYDEKDGLLSNLVIRIVGDNFGNIWVLTGRGISIFNENKPPGERFANLSADEGVLNAPTSFEAFIKSKNGDIYWGGANGIYRFYPSVQNTNPYLPPIRITNFKIFNNSVKLDSAVTEISTIKLAYHENFFTFSFAALDFTNPLQNQYAYKLEGINKDWVKAGHKTEASYTNVPPGRYVFRVKGSNNDDVWNEEGAAVRLIITPPWWRTNLAYAIYAVLFAATLYGWRRFEVNRVKLRNELKMKNFEAQKLHEIDHIKSRFFANISHEFRTPLTLILGPVEQMLSGEFKGNLQENYRMILRNGRRLLRLINQLLDLSKLESGRMALLARREDVVSLVKGIAQSFASWAERKRITLDVKVPQEPIWAYVDRDKLEKIVSNLLSNAFKFTPEGGSVAVAVAGGSEKGDGRGEKGDGRALPPSPIACRTMFVEISVKDTGPGIPAEHLEKIFDRFYQVEMADTRSAEGTGIGLALTKELVELHRGEVLVNSEVGRGTTFVVRLPLGKDHLRPEEIVEEVTSDRLPVTSEQLSVTSKVDIESQRSTIEQQATSSQRQATSRSEAKIPIHRDDETIILVVEDNHDVRTYVRSHLEPSFKVVEAGDGAEGVEKALEIIPDLIISDVMMPGKDGYELCRILKTDEKTSHVPIILLTAKASSESKISGLETGADDYLIKPFDSKELRARVKNLIKLRRQLHERFRREIILQPKEIAVTSADERFLQRAMTVVEAHVSDSDFSVEQFARSAGMSQTQLHRKLKALTGQSANQFIRTLRLKRAAFLLQKHTGNVAEIAYEVGFNNPSYFAECFRKQFGVLPSQYGDPT